MIYQVKKGEVAFEIDDNMLYDKQPKQFKELFGKLKVENMADFDNCIVLVLYTGRVIITEKTEEDGIV